MKSQTTSFPLGFSEPSESPRTRAASRPAPLPRRPKGRWFVGAIGHPEVMKLATRYGLPRPLLMRFTLKLLANLTDPRGGDALDRVINGLARIAPAA